MQVFKTFFRILNKTKVSIIVYVGVFLGIMIAFSIFGGRQTTNNVNFTSSKVNICIIDRDNSEASKAFKESMGNTNQLVELKDDKDVWRDEMFYRNVEYIAIIPSGFQDSIIKRQEVKLETVKLPSSYTGSLIDMQVNDFVNTISVYLKNGMRIDTAIEKTKENQKITTDVKVMSEDSFGSSVPGYVYFYQYFSYVIVAVTIIGVGAILLQFNKLDIRRRHFCSAIKPNSINIQLAFGCFIFTVAIWVLMNVICILMYHSEIQFWSNLPYFLFISFIYTIVGLSIGFFSSAFCKSENGISGMSNTLSLGFSFVGGVFVPIEVMSNTVVQMSKFTPTYWYMQVVNRISGVGMKANGSMDIFWKCTFVMFLFAVAFMAVALLLKKRALQSSK